MDYHLRQSLHIVQLQYVIGFDCSFFIHLGEFKFKFKCKYTSGIRLWFGCVSFTENEKGGKFILNFKYTLIWIPFYSLILQPVWKKIRPNEIKDKEILKKFICQ